MKYIYESGRSVSEVTAWVQFLVLTQTLFFPQIFEKAIRNQKASVWMIVTVSQPGSQSVSQLTSLCINLSIVISVFVPIIFIHLAN